MPGLGDAVALAREEDEAALHAEMRQPREEVHRLRHGVRPVPLPVEEDGRGGHLVEVGVGGALEPVVPVRPRVAAQVPAQDVEVEAGSELALPVRHHRPQARRLEAVGLGDGPAAQDAAVAPALHRQRVGVGDAGPQHVVDPGHDVVVVPAPDVVHVAAQKLVAVAGGAAHVGLDDGVSRGGEDLGVGVEAAREDARRPAVDLEHQRLGLGVEAAVEDALDGEPVAAGPPDDLGLGQLALRHPRVGFGEAGVGAPVHVRGIDVARSGRRVVREGVAREVRREAGRGEDAVA